MKLKLLVLLLALLTLTGASSAAQTEDCPVGLVCVSYEDYVLDIDPACGVVQAIVVEENLARTTSLTGVKESFGVRGVVVSRDGGNYEVIGEFSGPAEGSLEGVRFGSVGCIEWLQEGASEQR